MQTRDDLCFGCRTKIYRETADLRGWQKHIETQVLLLAGGAHITASLKRPAEGRVIPAGGETSLFSVEDEREMRVTGQKYLVRGSFLARQ